MQAQQLNGIQDLLSAAEVDVASLADGCEARRRAYNVPQDFSGSRLTIRSGDHVLQDLAAVLGVSQQGSDIMTRDDDEGEAAATGYVEVAKLKEKVRKGACEHRGERAHRALNGATKHNQNRLSDP